MYLKANTAEEAVSVVYTQPCFLENEKTYGVAHLLEHMIANSYEELNNKLQVSCITNNAFTDIFSVCFYIKGLREEINKYKQKYLDLIINYKPLRKHFDKELPIVRQECNDMYSDSQNNFFINIYSKKFGYIFPIGTKEVLDSITFEDVEKFYFDYFVNPEIHEIASEKLFSTEKQTITPFATKALHFCQSENKPIDENCVHCAVVSDFIESDKLYILNFISDMLGDASDITSPLMTEIREKRGLSYWVQCSYLDLYSNKASLIIMTSVKKENIPTFFNLVFDIMTDYKHFLTEERFNQVLSKKKIRCKLNSINNSKLIQDFYYEQRESVNDMKNLDSITYKDVVDFYEEKIKKAFFQNISEYSLYE